MSMTAAEERFRTRMAELTGHSVKLAEFDAKKMKKGKMSKEECEEEEHKEAQAKIASMGLQGLLEHPSFIAGFESQLKHRCAIDGDIQIS